MELRPYQTDAISKIRGAFSQKKRRVVLCLPTGGGKTVIFSEMVRRAMERDLFAKVLILTDRMELLTQAGGTLQRLGIEFDTIEAGKKVNMSARCHVGMVETYVRRIEQFPDLIDYNLVIIDEAHKGNFRKVLGILPDRTFIIGATATPVAAKKTYPLKDYFDDIVCPVTIPELISQGYLVPAITYSARIDRSGLKKQGGEYSEQSQMNVFDRRERYDGVVDKWLEFARGRKTMCFCVNIKHSKETAQAFNDAGIPAMHVDGSTPEEERAEIFKAHQNGEFLILCNVGIATAGYDDPSISCIIFNRVTTSITTWLQCCGRGSRPYPGKKDFIILDMGENYTEHGLWESDTDWKHIFHFPKKAGKGIAPTKMCPGCDAILPASNKFCSYCGYVFPVQQRDEKYLNVEFERVDSKKIPVKPKPKPPRSMWHSLTVDQMADYVRCKTYKPGWAVRLILNKPDPVPKLYKFASLMGYRETWVDYQLNMISTPSI